ncbi:ankyrin repeat domain-containing protein [Flavobacterium orientale]|uniref:Ankyrin repeat-containing protein n=1 Tax=Flavobacterium orientale TaxID=1756020 RepID=A0A917DDZ0_9FLAO|nr:ankyrin repeat domain-containing protein [Flavobacterium orientale]GGD29336.1 ankyrin repeat-containing protein [Flavobacterium orientale]
MKKIIFVLIFIQSLPCFSQRDIFSIARDGNVKELIAYLELHPNAGNEVTKEGFSPLVLACYRGNKEVAQFLIENSKDLNSKSTMGTPLMAVAVKGYTDLAQLLLKNGANPDGTDEKGTTALMYAVQFRNIELVKVLLEHNANKTLQDKNGKTAFEFAVFSGNDEIINLLK